MLVHLCICFAPRKILEILGGGAGEGSKGDAFYEATLICCGVVFVTQLGVNDLNCRRYRMKAANSPVISTSRSLNQALSSRTAAFVMTAIKYKKHSLKLIFQF